MMIGPAPIIRMVERSVRFGIGSFALARAAGAQWRRMSDTKKGAPRWAARHPRDSRAGAARFRVKPLPRGLALKPRYTKITSRERVGRDEGGVRTCSRSARRLG